MTDQILFEAYYTYNSVIEFKTVGLINRMGIPCGYVGFNVINEDLHMSVLQNIRNNIGNINVHGGITFNDDIERTDCLPWMAKPENSKYTWIGWDYSHYNDHHPDINPNSRKYFEDKICREAYSVVKQLISIIE